MQFNISNRKSYHEKTKENYDKIKMSEAFTKIQEKFNSRKTVNARISSTATEKQQTFPAKM